MNLPKKVVIVCAVMAAVGFGIVAAGHFVDETATIQALTAQTICPVAGCSGDSCHDYANVPEPDGVSEMMCPEAHCSSVECHAWDSLSGRYHQASDGSLTVWIVLPVILVLVLVIVMRGVGRNGATRNTDRSSADNGEANDEN